MAAGLQGDIGRGAPGLLAGGVQGMNLGVGTAGALMPTLANYVAILDDDAADTGIGIGGV